MIVNEFSKNGSRATLFKNLITVAITGGLLSWFLMAGYGNILAIVIVVLFSIHLAYFLYALIAGTVHKMLWPKQQIELQFLVNMRSPMDWGRVLMLPKSWFNRDLKFEEQSRCYHLVVMLANFVFMVIGPLLAIGMFMFPTHIAKCSTRPQNYRGKVGTYCPVVMMTAQQMARWPGYARFRALYASLWTSIRYRTKVVVAGAYTAPMTSAADDLAAIHRVCGLLPFLGFLRNVVVTHGDTLSVAFAFDQGMEFIKHYGLEDKPVLVIGGTGMIGQATAELFLQAQHPVIIAGRDVGNVDSTIRHIATLGGSVQGAVWENGEKASERYPSCQGLLAGIPIIWLATSSPYELVRRHHFHEDRAYLVVDVGAPHNAERDLIDTPNVVVRDGAIATSDFYSKFPAGFEMGCPLFCGYACQAEGITLAWLLLHDPNRIQEIKKWTLTGTIDVRLVAELRRAAQEAGIVPDRPSWYGKRHELLFKDELPTFAGSA